MLIMNFITNCFQRLFLPYGRITAVIPHPTNDGHVFVAKEEIQKGQKGERASLTCECTSTEGFAMEKHVHV